MSGGIIAGNRALGIACPSTCAGLPTPPGKLTSKGLAVSGEGLPCSISAVMYWGLYRGARFGPLTVSAGVAQGVPFTAAEVPGY